MHLSKNMLSFALLASALSVGSSYAEQLVKFHLPVPVKWGNTMLAPGDYRMEFPTSTQGVQSVFLSNDKKTVIALPLAMGSVEPSASNRSYLQLVNVNGTYFVRKYTSGITGRLLMFSVPKVHNDSIAKNTMNIEGEN